MRSISLKLTLAFLSIGLVGAALVALYAGVQAQSAFGKFFFDLERSSIVASLTDHYATHGSWEGVVALFQEDHAWRQDDSAKPMAITLTDPEHRVIVGPRRYPPGSRLRVAVLKAGVPLEIEGEVVGYLYFENLMGPWRPDTPEGDFLERIQRAILLSAITAGAAALVASVILARTLTQPIRKLTEATHAVANGDLGRQVRIDQQDEIGDLAAAFNQMSADLARTNRLRRQMTADIAHDLRTPLTVLLGYTEGLADGKLQGTPATYATMHREAQHLNRLISDLRLLSLADAGELPLNRCQVAPTVLLERAAAAHSVQAAELGIGLAVEAPAQLPAVLVDPERMAQVLNNLVTNALRYTPPGGTITLGATRDKRCINLSVSDTGTGIAPQDLPLVFERFYRTDPSRTQTSGESGLGLAIVKSLVEAHDGTVRVSSEAGSGTTFTVALPIPPPSHQDL
ncbi:MAG: HAMP domain-containing protein [Anaerolineae bacterium]|nr:HAMP domain-containing protein [Anaerolineae bacterium]